MGKRCHPRDHVILKDISDIEVDFPVADVETLFD
jgi:hypothetical protein